MPLGRRSDEEGSALAVAMVVAVVLLALGATVAARGVGIGRAALGHEHRTSARLIAELALDDTVRALGGPTYREAIAARTGAPAAPIDVADVTISSLSSDADVEVDVRPGMSPDVQDVEVTATVGDALHRASARVRPFLTADHALMTEHRTIDPALLQLPRVACTLPDGDVRRSPSCRDAMLDLGALDGPVHLNEGGVIPSGTGAGPLVTGSRPDAHSDGEDAGPLVSPWMHRPDLRLPRTIAQVIGQASVTCRFLGPTSIRFDGPVVRVRSPLTAAAAGTVSERSVGCLDVDLATLDAFVAIALPEQAVIEVVRDERPGCVGHPLGIPSGEDADRSWSCAAGDAFVWGRYAGRRTLLAEDDIQIVWDVEPGDAAAPAPLERGDLLGLVAGDSVVLRRPVGRPNRRVAPLGPNLPVFGPGLPPFGAYPLDAPSEVPVTWDRPRIVAALAALRGSVTLQNPFLGQQHPGPLEIVGSVAARFPGVLAWEERTSTGTLIGETGYPAVLRYDRRLLLDAPPLLPMTDGGGLRILHRDLG